MIRMIGRRSFRNATRTAMTALACVVSASVVQAGTITSFSTVTVPSTFSTSTTLGPQSVVISFSNTLTASRPLNLRLAVTGAAFVTTTAPTLTLTGSSGIDASICTTTSGIDAHVIQCTPTGGSSITGIQVAGLSYTNATALSSTTGAIKLSGSLSTTSIGTFEDIASKDVVTRSSGSSGTSGVTGTVLRQGAVYSSAQTSAISLVRFYNGGTTAGTVSVTLADYLSGQTLTTWTSPSIAAGSAAQYAISTLESGGTATSFTKPDYYSLSVTPGFSGTFQHVLYRPSDGVLTNLSTCDSGITAPANRVVNVHSARLGANGFPSTVVIYNTGTASAAATLTVTDARDGTTLGSAYTTSSIPANGELVLPVSTIETGATVTPTSDQLHYVITAQSSFTGYLQHRVNNQQAGVITDMSTVCTLSTTTTGAPTPVSPSDRR
jgi:hypothetical protein